MKRSTVACQSKEARRRRAASIELSRSSREAPFRGRSLRRSWSAADGNCFACTGAIIFTADRVAQCGLRSRCTAAGRLLTTAQYSYTGSARSRAPLSFLRAARAVPRPAPPTVAQRRIIRRSVQPAPTPRPGIPRARQATAWRRGHVTHIPALRSRWSGKLPCGENRARRVPELRRHAMACRLSRVPTSVALRSRWPACAPRPTAERSRLPAARGPSRKDLARPPGASANGAGLRA